MNIISQKILTNYKKHQKITLNKYFDKLSKSKSKSDIVFSLVLSSVHSSMLEGVDIDMDSYFNSLDFMPFVLNKDFYRTKDLISGYDYARVKKINKSNILAVHRIITKNILAENYRGVLRDKEVVVKNTLTGATVYQGCKVVDLKKQYNLFIKDVEFLANQKLSIDEVFYYAAFLHFVFVSIHPFADGNGRLGRLIEKWFLATHLGEMAWLIPSEFMYNKRKKNYYQKLALPGKSYETLNYAKVLDFLLMLPLSLTTKIK